MSEPSSDVARILEVGLGFWPSKVLLTAVELEVFTQLSGQSMTGEELGRALALHPRGIWDFLDALVALGFLERDGDGPSARYENTASTAKFLDKHQPDYMGGIFEMSSQRLFRFWADLGEALRTGRPQNEVKHTGKPIFEALYANEAGLEQFMSAMRGISAPNFQALAEKFDFSSYRTLCDVGGATAQLSTVVAARHPHLRCVSFDLPPGGAFIAIENLIDDARRENAFGLMMSLNMLIEFGDAFDFTGADFWSWCQPVGFRRYEILPLAGPCSAAIAYK
jgi:hypothetical protein